LSRAAAGLLGSGAGHSLRVYLELPGASAATQPPATQFSVRAVLADGVLAGPQATVLLPLATMQQLLGKPDQVNEVLVVNRCGSDAASCSQRATLDLRKALIDRTAAEQV